MLILWDFSCILSICSSVILLPAKYPFLLPLSAWWTRNNTVSTHCFNFVHVFIGCLHSFYRLLVHVLCPLLSGSAFFIYEFVRLFWKCLSKIYCKYFYQVKYDILLCIWYFMHINFIFCGCVFEMPFSTSIYIMWLHIVSWNSPWWAGLSLCLHIQGGQQMEVISLWPSMGHWA